jgi:hypothetical protein
MTPALHTEGRSFFYFDRKDTKNVEGTTLMNRDEGLSGTGDIRPLLPYRSHPIGEPQMTSPLKSL